MSKILFSVSLIIFATFALSSESYASNNAGNDYFLASLENTTASENLLFASFFASDSEYFPFTGRRSRDSRKGSEASKRSQSRRLGNTRSQSYRPPDSGSIQAGSLGSDRPTPSPSSVSQTRGGGRLPLRMSERDRYFGVGSRELGFNLGTAHSFTDIQGSKNLGFGESVNFQISNPGITFGFFSRFRMVEWFGLSIGFDYARLSGEDQNDLNNYEGYSFENNLIEFNARVAFYAPLATKNEFDIYAFAGLGLFSNHISLKNADGLEVNPSSEFSSLQPAIPFGVGLSWLLGQRMVIGYEIGYRYTAFNMLDGVEPPDTRYDAYLFNTLRIGFILKPRRR
jgi:opacity protein-like surface antigen